MPRWSSWAALGIFVLGSTVTGVAVLGPATVAPPSDLVLYVLLLMPAVLTGVLVAVRAPASPVGGALAWVGAAPAAVLALEYWGRTLPTPDPWPGARVAATFGEASWPCLYLGFVALMLVFPDGLLPGRRWRVVAAMAPVAALVLTVAIALAPGNFAGQGGPAPGEPPSRLPVPLHVAVLVLAFGLFLAVLVGAAIAVVVRFRRGDPVTRLRVRWLMLAGCGVPVLLPVTWVSIALGAPADVAFLGFLVVVLVLVPAAVAIAVLRHDLFDVDRLLGQSLAWGLTTALSAAIFATVVATSSQVFGRGSAAGATGAAFVTALCLLPLHRLLQTAVGRVVDRDRYVVLAGVRQFVAKVRDGEAEPEAVEDMLRAQLNDPGLRLLLRMPRAHDGAQVDLRGKPAEVAGDAPQVALRTGDTTVGVLVLGNGSARRLRRARDAAMEARLPIEVSRLRLHLRGALNDVQASRARLVAAGDRERAQLERDLHDGAQQQIVTVGMRLRSVQHRLDPTDPAYDELDDAVAALETTLIELRRLAHGVRPARLEDGLAPALRALVTGSPVPVELTVPDIALPDPILTTAYYVVAEALTNAYKHATATRVSVLVQHTADQVQVRVHDDGCGGASDGFGLTSLRDRVAAVGGTFCVRSPVGASTDVEVDLPCAL